MGYLQQHIYPHQVDAPLIEGKTISTDIEERIATMGNLFIIEGLVKPYILETDSVLLKSNGHVWHK